MSTPTIDLPLAEIAEICRTYHVAELSLFGSALRDDFRPDSDLDVLVIFQDQRRIGITEFADLQLALTRLFHREVDLVLKNGLKALIRDDVFSTARVVYAARCHPMYSEIEARGGEL